MSIACLCKTCQLLLIAIKAQSNTYASSEPFGDMFGEILFDIYLRPSGVTISLNR